MPISDFLKELLFMQSVSGEEAMASSWISSFVDERKSSWKVVPEIYRGEDFHDCILLKFGNPRTAVFAHIDTIGFMARYANQLIPVGGPELIPGTKLVGKDSLGEISCKLRSVLLLIGVLFYRDKFYIRSFKYFFWLKGI